METLQTDREGLRQHLEEHILSDPMDLEHYIEPERVLMVLAKFDGREGHPGGEP